MLVTAPLRVACAVLGVGALSLLLAPAPEVGASSSDYDEKIKILLFTRTNPTAGQTLRVDDASLLKESNFDPSQPTKIHVHGWLSSQNDGMGGSYIREGLLEAGDFNVILVDWSALDSINYFSSRWKVPSIGKHIGALVQQLQLSGNLQLSDLHLIGHSLGAHIMGFAGRTAGLGSEGRITGLDPAGPLFWNDPKVRLDSSDAGFVDIIHTCAGVDGYTDPIGHADFYPNGGSYRQPGCGLDIGTTCSHCRAYLLLIESMDTAYPFIGTQCNSYKAYENGDCDDNPTAELGFRCDTSVRGNYYFETNGSSPFSKNALGDNMGSNAARCKGQLTKNC